MTRYSMDSPCYDARVVTPGDSTDIRVTRALYVGATGNVNVRMASGATVLFATVPAGAILPISVDRVLSTSTTASTIVAMY